MQRSVFEPMMREMVSKFEIDTRYFPTVVIDDPFNPSAKPNQYATLLKPKIKVHLRGGTQPIVMSPYGDPGVTQWQKVKSGLIIGSAVAFAGLAVLTIKALKK